MHSKIENIITEPLRLLGYNVVRVTLGGKIRKTLQIMIERLDDVPIIVDDCAKASYNIGPLLDVENVIDGPYNLEISSTGLNRPLVKKEDFIKYVGRDVIVKTHRIVVDRKRFKAVLSHADEENITIQNDLGSFIIPYQDILSACLNVEDSIFAKQ